MFIKICSNVTFRAETIKTDAHNSNYSQLYLSQFNFHYNTFSSWLPFEVLVPSHLTHLTPYPLKSLRT